MGLMRGAPVRPLEMLPPNLDPLHIRTGAGPPTIGVREPTGLDPPSIFVHIPPSVALIVTSITRAGEPVPSLLSPLFGVGGIELDLPTLNDRDHWGRAPVSIARSSVAVFRRLRWSSNHV